MVKMKKISFCLISLAFVMISCEPNLERILPGKNETWEVERVAYELTWDFTLIESTNNDTAGSLTFLENGRGFWDNGKERLKNEVFLGDSFRWEATGKEVEILFDLEQEEIDQDNKKRFDFQVLRNEKNSQVWRYERDFSVYNPQIRDSSDARIVWQWQLVRN